MSQRDRPSRSEKEFFLHPRRGAHRRYEALRSYFVEGATAREVAVRFRYTPHTVRSLVRDFRAGDDEFFVVRRSGPSAAPAKDAARARIVALRRRGLTLDQIAERLRAESLPLNRTGIAEVLREEGFPRLGRRPGDASPRETDPG